MDHSQQTAYDAYEFNSAQAAKDLQLLAARLLYHREQVILCRALVTGGMSKEDAECAYLAGMDNYDERIDDMWNYPAEEEMAAEMDEGFVI